MTLKIPLLYGQWKSFLSIVQKERKREKIIKSFLLCFPNWFMLWLAINTIRKTIHKLLKINQQELNFPEWIESEKKSSKKEKKWMKEKKILAAMDILWNAVQDQLISVIVVNQLKPSAWIMQTYFRWKVKVFPFTGFAHSNPTYHCNQLWEEKKVKSSREKKSFRFL